MTRISRTFRFVLLTLSLLLGGEMLPMPEPASAAVNSWHGIRYGGVVRGKVRCFYQGNDQGIVQWDFWCEVVDQRTDRFTIFVVPSYWDGARWRVVAAFANRACTATAGPGTSLYCVQPNLDFPNRPLIPMRFRIGLIDKRTGEVVKTITVFDEWESPDYVPTVRV